MRNLYTAAPSSTLWGLQEGTAALICTPPDDVRALAYAMMALPDDPSRRAEMSARGRKYVEQQAAREVVLGRYAELICERKGPLP